LHNRISLPTTEIVLCLLSMRARDAEKSNDQQRQQGHHQNGDN
jgi:hypothetical protein